MRIEAGRLLPYIPGGEAITRRQDTTTAYSRDGTVYAVRRDVLLDEHSLYGSDCRPLLISREESINLDDLEDWATAEARVS
jgi:CMP-N-acetylneuraminic acid synthetase